VCTSNIKQMTQIFFNYAGDFDGYSPKSATTAGYWAGLVTDLGYIKEPSVDSTSIMLCPTQIPGGWGGCNATYALSTYRDQTSPTYNSSNHYGWWCYYDTPKQMPVFRIDDPSGQPWLADSVNGKSSTGSYGCQFGAYNTTIVDVHLRHFRQATIGFVDGSARPCNASYIVNDLSNPYPCLMPPFLSK